jgi:hypothetical protein
MAAAIYICLMTPIRDDGIGTISRFHQRGPTFSHEPPTRSYEGIFQGPIG